METTESNAVRAATQSKAGANAVRLAGRGLAAFARGGLAVLATFADVLLMFAECGRR